MHIVFSLCAALLVIATLLPLSNSRQWYVRALDFPRLQLLVLCAIWLLLSFASQASGHPLVIVSTICVCLVAIYQCYWIIPNTQLYAVEVQSCLGGECAANSSITLLSSNVLMHNRNAQALLTLVAKHQPDVLITLESDHWWQQQLDTLNSYPYRIACPLDNLYGMHVYSRLPLSQTSINYLVEHDKPSMQMKVQLANRRQISLHVLHPAPPAPGENSKSIERDVELLVMAKHVAAQTGPVIVAGDLNDVAWSATTRLFREISGLKDPRTGRGVFSTFNARYWFIRWPLDHIFVSEHFRLLSVNRLPDIGSDHFPLLATFALDNRYMADESPSQEVTDDDLLEHIQQTDTARQSVAPTQ